MSVETFLASKDRRSAGLSDECEDKEETGDRGFGISDQGLGVYTITA